MDDPAADCGAILVACGSVSIGSLLVDFKDTLNVKVNGPYEHSKWIDSCVIFRVAGCTYRQLRCHPLPRRLRLSIRQDRKAFENKINTLKYL